LYDGFAQGRIGTEELQFTTGYFEQLLTDSHLEPTPIHVDNALIVNLQAEQNRVPFPFDYFQNPTHGMAWVSQGSMTSTLNYAVQVAPPVPFDIFDL
jgi:hypothetical protein